VTDRSLRADQLAHARRTNPQTDDLRARIAEALNACPAQFIQDTPDGGGWFKDRP
jgi:ferredoxin